MRIKGEFNPREEVASHCQHVSAGGVMAFALLYILHSLERFALFV
jgi:hypothetical protein